MIRAMRTDAADDTLLARDARAIAGIGRLRFSPFMMW